MIVKTIIDFCSISYDGNKIATNAHAAYWLASQHSIECESALRVQEDCILEGFHKMAGALGYSVEKIKQPVKSERIPYRDYWISFNPKPVPASCGVDWDWHHDDYDGAPDGNDNRCGCSASLEAAKADIDEQIDELDEEDLASAMMQQLCKELEGGAL